MSLAQTGRENSKISREHDHMPDVDTPRVLVTGGASGIGAAIWKTFMENGCRVAILDRDQEALDRLIGLRARPHLLLNADVTDSDSLAKAFAALDAEWGGLDVLCNNAGVSFRERFLDTSLHTWNETISVNLTGAFLVAQAAARRMWATNGGAIINTASVSGIVGMPNYSAYNVSKAGIIELTKTMALELAPRIRVNAVCPGYVLTPMQRREYTEDMINDCAAVLPAGRLGKPSEIAALIAYLASDDATFITGQSFVIDGGETAGGLASR
ncbi:SDR family NAD(P)-dependent oxidoreductase [Streptomyces collinus]|uniref:SDR family NAD(P)-dependent oxidoreductase n=1 Tax=Streptomyces collinus TaxID=42684 RepID=UPI00369EC3D9